jgi:hypothetical protein
VEPSKSANGEQLSDYFRKKERKKERINERKEALGSMTTPVVVTPGTVRALNRGLRALRVALARFS